MFLLSSDRRQYGDLILSLKNDYAKQHRNYPKTLIDTYGPMVAFDPTRETPMAGVRNKGMNFTNVVAEFEDRGNRDIGDDRDGEGRKWNSGTVGGST